MSSPTIPLKSLAAGLLVHFLSLGAPTSPAAAAPTSFDWTDQGGVNLVSSVKNQRSCSSCWIFSGVGMVESRWMIRTYESGQGLHEIDLSEQYIMDCGSGYFGAFECGAGGFTHDVLIHLRDVGAPVEACYEYVAADGDCPTDCPDSGSPLVLYTPVDNASYVSSFMDHDLLMDEIYANGPVAATMDVYGDFYSYSSGVYQHVSGSYAGGKAILIVGWGWEGSTPYWICKNTWGTGWGEDGYFRILRDDTNAGCDFAEWVFMADVSPDVSAAPDTRTPAPVLAQNVPNPFNPTTEIAYTPAADGPAVFAVYDVAGRKVRILADAVHVGGREYRVTWDGRDDTGRIQPSGLYFYRLEQNGHRETRRMVMLR